MNPKVSICIPAYKQVELLRKVLDSIRIQTFNDYELIITDDSPDDSVEILLKGFNFSNILFYHHNSSALGSPSNWNYAISLAKGEYIKILHTDDFFTSTTSLEKYVGLLDENPEADLGFSASEVFNISTNTKGTYSCSNAHLKRLQAHPDFLFFKNVIGGPSATIYRRKMNIAYDVNLKWVVDIDFYIRVLNTNPVVAYTPEPLICTTDGAEGQITQSVINNDQIQIREHVLLFTKLKENGRMTNERKYLLFFKLLFNKFKLKSIVELNQIIPLSDKQKSFFTKVITSVNAGMVITRLKVKFYNSILNKNIFKMEIY